MTIQELKDIISGQIILVNDSSKNGQERTRILENAEYISKLSKQFINASDIQIRMKRMDVDEKKLNQNVSKD